MTLTGDLTGIFAIIEFSVYALMTFTALTAYFTVKSRV